MCYHAANSKAADLEQLLAMIGLAIGDDFTWRLARMRAWLTAGLLAMAGASAQAQQLSTIDDDAHYPEGPLWHEGKLFYVEYSAHTIKTWDGHHVALMWHSDGCGPSALIPLEQHLLVACYDDNSLVELDASGRTIRIIRS